MLKGKDEVIKGIDPNDPMYGQKVESALKQWREETMEPALQKFGEGFTTQKSQAWAEHFIDTTREHMFHQTAADTSTAAGIGVQNSIRTFANSATNAALRDPSVVPTQLDLAEHSIGGLVQSSPLRGVNAAKVQSEVLEKTREQIVKAGAIGAIQKSDDPEAVADDWINKYPQYINGAEAKQLAVAARQQIRARNYDFEFNRRRNREIAADRSNEATNQYLIDIRSRDPKLANDPTAKTILNDPSLTKQDKNNLLNLIDRQVKPETDARISAMTTVDFLRRLRDPNANLDQLMNDAWDARVKDPGAAGSLTERDFNVVRTEIGGRKTPEGAALARDRDEFFKRFIATIDPNRDKATGLGGSALGDQKIYQAMEDAKRQEAFLRSKGIDPHSLYDPASPNFFGKSIQKYRPTLQEEAAFKAQLKADQNRKEVSKPTAVTPSKPANFNERFGFDAAATVTSKAEYDRLAPGTEFTSNGRKYRKPAETAPILPVNR